MRFRLLAVLDLAAIFGADLIGVASAVKGPCSPRRSAQGPLISTRVTAMNTIFGNKKTA
jgi:hypothetical protein